MEKFIGFEMGYITMANSLEEFSNDFKETINVIFNETEGSEWYKDFLCKLKKLTEKDDKKVGYYGCSIGTIELMLFIRKRMRDEGLAPDIALENNSFKKRDRLHYIKRYCPKFCNLFPRTCECEEKYDLNYKVDGWNYTDIKYSCEDWIKILPVEQKDKDNSVKEYLTHLYYNELDHYLTNCVSKLKNECVKNENSSDYKEGIKAPKERGLLCIREEIKDKF